MRRHGGSYIIEHEGAEPKRVVEPQAAEPAPQPQPAEATPAGAHQPRRNPKNTGAPK